MGGLTVAELRWLMSSDTTGFDRGVDHADRKFGGFAGRLLKGAAGLVVGAGAALAGIGAAGGLMGVQVAAGNEQAMISFETMLGSAQKARSFLDDLQKFAAATPFEFPELQQAASSLISAGIEADKVIPIMTTLGDVTSGMGTGSEGVQRATIALQQMSAAGRITGEDLNQLRDAGIPVYDLLAKATGKSKAEVVKLAQAGKLGSKELGQMMKALETGKGLERFSGLMEKQSASLTGMWSTFKDTIGQNLATAITPLIPMLKDGLGGATTFLGAALAKLPGILTTVIDGAQGLYAFIAEGDFTGAFSRAFNVEEDAPIVGTLFTIRDTVISVAATAVDAFQTIGGAVLSTVAFFQDHEGAAIALGAVVGAVLATMIAAWTAQGAVAVINSVKSALAWYATATASTTSATIQSRSTAQIVVGWLRAGVAAAATAVRVVAGWVLMGAQSLIQAARMAVAWVIAMGPVGWVIAAVIGLVALIIANWDKVSAWTAKAWAAVSGFVVGNAKKAIGWVKANWPLILAILTGPIGLAVLFIVRHWDQITTGARRMKDAVVGKLGELVGFVKGIPGKILDALGDLAGSMVGKGEDIVTGIIRGIGNMGGKLRDFVIKFVKDHIPGPVAKALGIASPSKVMADKVGRWIPLGVVEGIKSTAPELDREIARMARVPGSLDNATAAQRRAAVDAATASSQAAGRGGPLVNIENYHEGGNTPGQVAHELVLEARTKGIG